MIKRILLKNVATYDDSVEIIPTRVNFLYGSNGSGKTTISNLIDAYGEYSDCSLEWEDRPLETFVYNKNFVEKNFAQNSSIEGIFTLGEDSIETFEKMEKYKDELVQIEKNILKYKKTRSDKLDEINYQKKRFLESCWNRKADYEKYFKEAFIGFLSNKNKFFEECIRVHTIDKKEEYKFDEIRVEYDELFNSTLNEININLSNFKIDLNSIEETNLLSEIIIGKSVGPISEFINRLESADWIHEGLSFLPGSDGKCPFCQEELKLYVREQIENFFDEEYKRKCLQIEQYKAYYSIYNWECIDKLMALINGNNIDILDFSNLKREVEILSSIVEKNMIIIDQKIKSPSGIFAIESAEENFERISEILDSFIQKINKNNKLVKSKKINQEILKKKVWSLFLDSMKNEFSSFVEAHNKKENILSAITSNIDAFEQERGRLLQEISVEEAKITDVKYTVSQINRILKLFSFDNFHLVEANERGFYRIERQNGQLVHDTLSEGEFRFITFLYFVNLIKGSTSTTSVSSSRVVVFDDPISSLDSAVLFVVSNLIKDIVRVCKAGGGIIKQIFILTHNVYFHKEVTFKGLREKSSLKEESFFIVKKVSGKSQVNKFRENPIRTAYELLWKEVANPESAHNPMIYNTLRRILEYYFNILGSMNYEDCVNNFEGDGKIVCRSLLSWINDGSHFIEEEIMHHTDYEDVEKYLSVFKMIFEKMNHISHYEMMVDRCKVVGS